MAIGEDWLQDPLMEIGKGRYHYRKLKSLDDGQNDLWQTFHFATRLKLDGAAYFCRQALGAASIPDDLGLPLLAHRQLEWYLDAFFFELMSAYDILLQELNIVYAYDSGFKLKDVRWNEKKKNKFMEKLPEEIFNYIKEEREKNWLYEVTYLRNQATHHYTVPLASDKVGVGGQPLGFYEYTVFIFCQDKDGKTKPKSISVCCYEYLMQMAMYISSVWKEMAQEFK